MTPRMRGGLRFLAAASLLAAGAYADNGYFWTPLALFVLAYGLVLWSYER